MITAEQLKILTSLGPQGLTTFLNRSGYKQDKVTECQFLGMTNGGQFCYKIDYDNFGTKEYRKAFLSYDHATGVVSADIG